MKKSVLTFCLVFFILNVFAQVNKTWAGANNANWSTPANWTPAGVPTTLDTVILSSINYCNVDINPTIAAIRALGSGNSNGLTNSTGVAKSITITSNPVASPVLYVEAGSTLILAAGAATSGVSISTYGGVGTNNTALVDGTIFIASTSAWNVANGTAITNVTVSGTGTIYIPGPHTGANIFLNSTTSNLKFLNGSTLGWGRNGGAIPAADYQSGSTINITGISSTMPSLSNAANYSGLLIWNCPGQTISGSSAVLLPSPSYSMDSIRVVATGTGTLRVTTEPAGYTLGHVEVQGGTLEMSSPLVTNKTGSITTDLKISGGTVYGNATFTGESTGGFAMTLTVGGKFSITGGTLNLTNRPVGFGGAFQLNVAGDVTQTVGTITATSAFGSQNQLVLNGALAQNLTMSTFSGPMSVVINNSSSAGVTLLSNLTVPAAPAAFIFSSGVLNTSAANLLTFAAGSQTFSASNLSYVDGPVKKIGNTAFTFPIGKLIPPSTNAYVSLSISAPGAATDAYTAEYKRSSAQVLSTNYAVGLDHVSDVDYWVLDRTSGSSPVNVTLNWTVQSSANGSALYINDISKLRIAHFNSAIPQWDTYGVSSTTGGFAAGSITLNGVNVFSPFSLASIDGSNPLPINLNYLNGVKQGSANYLNWKVTCTNNPSVKMVLERSVDTKNFSEINSITASALSCQQPFEYTDNYPAKGLNYYRLKMIDANGKTTYSSIIAILNKESGFEMVNLMPNIVTTNAILNVTAAQKTKMDVLITDVTGRQVQKIAYNLIAGSNQFTIDLSKLGTGMYQITGYTADGVSKAIRFVKQ